MKREYKAMPLTFDADKLPDRYFTKQEWVEVKRLIRAEGIEKHEAVQKVFDSRPATTAIVEDQGPLHETFT